VTERITLREGPTVDELISLLREAYSRVPEARLGTTRCVDYDPAGSTYEFTEADWSRRTREILRIVFEPTGIA